MSWLYLGMGTLVVTVFVSFVGGSTPAVVVLVIGIAATVAQRAGLDILSRLRPIAFDRRSAAISALWLIILGLVYDMGLVFSRSDNAYLLPFMMGYVCYFLGAVFMLAAASSDLIRRPICWFGFVTLWVVGVFGAAMFLLSLAIIPSQGYRDGGVFLSHLLGLLLLLPTLYVVGYLLPHKSWAGTDQPST